MMHTYQKGRCAQLDHTYTQSKYGNFCKLCGGDGPRRLSNNVKAFLIGSVVTVGIVTLIKPPLLACVLIGAAGHQATYYILERWK